MITFGSGGMITFGSGGMIVDPIVGSGPVVCIPFAFEPMP
jgi:hypothetical protein